MCIPCLGNFLSLFSFPSDFPEAWEILNAEISNCSHKMDQKQEHCWPMPMASKNSKTHWYSHSSHEFARLNQCNGGKGLTDGNRRVESYFTEPLTLSLMLLIIK